MKYELTEEHIELLSRGSYGACETLPEDVQHIINGYVKHNYDRLDEFLFVDDEFQIERATQRTFNMTDRVGTQDRYYDGNKGWRNRPKQNRKYSWLTWDKNQNPRYEGIDSILDIALQHGVIAKFLDQIATSKRGMNTNVKHGIVGWIVENNLHKDDDVIKVFLRGFFKGEQKVQIMQALIDDQKLDKLEIFWKSRAYAVQKKLIEIAPLEDLPFMLGTKNKRLLALIEKKMDKGIKLKNAQSRPVKIKTSV